MPALASGPAERMRRLQAVTSALADVGTLAEAAPLVLRQCVDALEGAAGVLQLLDAERGVLVLAAAQGYPEAALEGWQETPLALATPLAEAARAGAPSFLGSQEETLAAFPALGPALARSPFGARAALPLVVRGRVLGALGVSYAGERVFDLEDRAYLLTVAGQGAQALERARLLEQEQAARQEAQAGAARLAVLARASRVFSERQLDAGAVLEALGREVTGALAEACTVLLLSPDGTELVPEAVSARDGELAGAIRATLARVPARVDTALLGPVLQTGRSLLLPQLGLERMLAASRPEYHAFHRRYPLESFVVVRLHARGEPLGVMTLSRYTPGQPFSDADRLLAEDLAERAALALATARAWAREREARARAERLTAEAQAAVAVREEFLSVASHELKTPLTALTLRATALARELAALPGDAAGATAVHVDGLQRQVRRLGQLVEGLLDVTREGAGAELPLEREWVDLGALTRGLAARHAQEAAAAGCALAVEVGGAGGAGGGGPAPTGRWDRARLERVVESLLANALKFGAGRPVRLVVEADAAEARLTVEDGGIGVEPRDAERIFGRFERAVSGRHYGGLGLGLYVARELVRAHGGTLTLEPLPPGSPGARFTVRLPRG
jgi:signal transduction histidine kinase